MPEKKPYGVFYSAIVWLVIFAFFLLLWLYIYLNFIIEMKAKHQFMENNQSVNNDFKRAKLIEGKSLINPKQGAERAEFIKKE